ncbi:ABC transporter ATP-binding protein [Floricoccus penangensis]|uniref:Iron ABC transporter ATP-binding protein n=1 Tax=Floricoccus penangensis TaxID=1859475 RepID=A0A9Q5JF57_9LACT|nr:ABC transporter ATP-binding protein [Floricoccus penangensis]OFI45792.1 iron ABC transporter ATP-binding protein [Floricoccus penangensis]URZ88029.1 ABC transporter ATP-binding protein [Floricoccus penangensis]
MYFGAQNITVSYGNNKVIQNLSFEIKEGLTTAIIGKNGCGKSTLLKALGRLIKYDGQVTFKDEDLLKMSNIDIAKVMAILPQSPVAPENITVLDLVSLGRFAHQSMLATNLSKEDYDMVRRVMMETNVWDLRSKKIEDLSGGQRQRVWISMVLAQDSEIILLDEPTTYLDIVHQLEVLSLLRMFAKKLNKTVVYVLHDLNMVARFADEIIAMRDGKIVAQGPVKDVFNETVIKDTYDIRVHIGADSYAETPMIWGVSNG